MADTIVSILSFEAHLKEVKVIDILSLSQDFLYCLPGLLIINRFYL
jgi:hypothetical protein